jgi:[ribosomal protein S5]-alanine N-acetyltransferase
VSVEIDAERFHLRELDEEDASERYLAWFLDPAAAQYISAAASTKKLSDLRGYIEERRGRDDVLFLGIFDRMSGLHVGNIKYEPVDSAGGYAVMGVLIGDPEYRGKGVTPEVLVASARWLQENRGIREIVLGVHADNAAAMRVYEGVGFLVAPTPYIPRAHPQQATMVWHL